MSTELCVNACKEGKYCAQKTGDVRLIWTGEIKGEPEKSDVSISHCLESKGIITYNELLFPQDIKDIMRKS
jgi:hypothetical protein